MIKKVENMIPIEIILVSIPMLKEELSLEIVVVLDTPSTFKLGVTVITELEMVMAALVGIMAELVGIMAELVGIMAELVGIMAELVGIMAESSRLI